ncbi:MAG: hypothetical protein GY737_26530, partial [Desulfobacteraceae bacterium]|nr:hypothetical protein [Desulfobacteraceae bacterium]
MEQHYAGMTGSSEVSGDSPERVRSWDDPDGLGRQIWRRLHTCGRLTGPVRKTVSRFRNTRLIGYSPLAATLLRRWGGAPYGGAVLPMPLFSGRFPGFFTGDVLQASARRELDRSASGQGQPGRSVLQLSRRSMLSVPPRIPGYLSGGVHVQAAAAHRSPGGSIPASLAVQCSMPGMATAGHDKHRQDVLAPVPKAAAQDRVDTWADSGGSGSTVLRRMPIRGRSDSGGSGLTVLRRMPIRGRADSGGSGLTVLRRMPIRGRSDSGGSG